MKIVHIKNNLLTHCLIYIRTQKKKDLKEILIKAIEGMKNEGTINSKLHCSDNKKRTPLELLRFFNSQLTSTESKQLLYKELEKLIKNAIAKRAKRAVLAVLQALAIVAALSALSVAVVVTPLVVFAAVGELLVYHTQLNIPLPLLLLLAAMIAMGVASIVAAVVGVAIAKVIKHYCISSSVGVGVGVAAAVAVKIVGGTGVVVGVVAAVVGVIVGVVIAEAIAHYCINSSPVSNLRDLTPGTNNESAHESTNTLKNTSSSCSISIS
ncbi:hypothetical protein [Wolbachia endosymbiont of Chironomus riparius]|uniref:hypothetical protein n=1 Tax=Wolbachia endosymbiont of Chironomus riparius TaxID=2883238 RepID=UPI0020A123F9|nr:hypothetical protein [Wolbachia endosymbiont of Chironomus riparius]